MAGRTSASFGVGATITILALAALGFFVAFAVFYGKYSGALQKLQQAQNDQADVVRPDERNRDDVRLLIDEARSAGGKSLVGYLVEAQEGMMARVTGSRRDRPSDFMNKLSGVAGAESASLLSLIATRNTEIASLREQVKQADAARLAAIANQQAEVDRVAGIESSHKRTVDALTAMINQYRDMNEEYRRGTDEYKKNVDAELDKVKTAAAESDRRLQDLLQRMTEEKLILENQLASLRGQRNANQVRANDEYALVDGEIVSVDGAARQVFISLGRKHNVVLGMTFSVYANAAALRPDEEGNYPRGKASLEVVNVGESTSTCRIVSEVRGNPVVKGDVIANAVYDPNKVYKFVVYGNFDTDRDGIATELEQAEVRSMIEAWGGTLVTDLTGDADFLVLGQRPTMPIRPGSDAPLVVVLEFQSRTKDVQRYDELQRQAVATSVPILTENRLYTLIGKTPSPARR
ncbi:MAG: hypothetical protein HBSAPP03_19810 [Phycisphaerae bacterium]|nr:MAG: hypothetical protein HBSAPP03_19810 [Phycisphaerae bacterium]